MTLLSLILAIASVPLLLPALYLFALAILARRGRREAPAGFTPTLRMCIVVPAHDEATGIARTVHNLAALHYPQGLRRILVVADNCSDDTAAVARAAGADVLERKDLAHRGKGYALEAAFDHCLREAWGDAVVVVDADTIASPELLEEFAFRFRLGDRALQADYGVLNAKNSWRTRLMTIAFALFHGVRSSARERLGLSCGLRGNGMAFRTEVLAAVPHRAFSVVEDLEYGLDLGTAGIRVAYVGGAQVWGEMAPSEGASRSQRRRWEGGRSHLARERGGTSLRAAIQRRNATLLDLTIDLLLPPLSLIALGAALGTAISAVCTVFGWCVPSTLAPWLIVDALLCSYVLRGWAFSGTGARGLLDLLFAPLYVSWKLGLRFRRPPTPPAEWVRTAREDRPAHGTSDR